MIAKAKQWTYGVFSWFGSRRSEPDRNIFVFHDGERERRVDPLQALGIIEQAYPQLTMLAADIREASGEDAIATQMAGAAASENQRAALHRLVSVTHEAFGTTPFNETHGGTTHGEALQLLGKFMFYLREIKKKRDN